MDLERLKSVSKKVIGAKQVKKAVEKGEACRLFLAKDADKHVITPIEELGRQKGIPIIYVDSMQQLGEACRIDVGAAAVAVIRE